MKLKNNKLLIIGKKPLPLGGVTIHVQRLTQWLDYLQISHRFYDLKKFKLNTFIKEICQARYAHLHTSSLFLRFIFSIICPLLLTKSIITYHGNLGRYTLIKNYIDYLSIIFSYFPIVLNERSFDIAYKLNKKTILLSAFISNVNSETPLNDEFLDLIIKLRERCNHIFCTNAYDLAYDKNNQEIYSIGNLIDFFSKYPEWGLIISDPSGNYKNKYIEYISNNIIFLDSPHSFIEVIKKSDCFIRYTTTDGDSLSIHEALEYNVPVIATNVVSRPNGVILVKLNDFEELKRVISLLEYKADKGGNMSKQLPAIIKFYKKIFNYETNHPRP